MRTLKTLTFAAVMALSLMATTTDAFAKDAKHGRETAWTDTEPLPATHDEVFETMGVTWEE